jgi:hypothetical protein
VIPQLRNRLLARRDDADPFEAAEDVQLRQCKRVQAVEPNRIPSSHGVEPPAPAWASGHRAKLAPGPPQALSPFVMELGWKRARSHAGAIGLDHADHPADGARPNPEANASSAGDGVRTGYVRIRPVSNI